MRTLMLFEDPSAVPVVEQELEERDYVVEEDLRVGEIVEVSRSGSALRGYRIETIKMSSALKSRSFNLVVFRPVSTLN